MSISKEDITRVKGRGFLLNRGTEAFSGRVITAGGSYSAEELEAIAACARLYGNGRVLMTGRLSAEISGIPYDKIEAAEAFLAEHSLFFGGTGAKVRPIPACKGSTCVFGNIDTQALAKELHARFYIGMAQVKLPHKFKIAVGGCPNSCMKPSINDVGIEGHTEFTYNSKLCRGCGKCAKLCPMKAISVIDGKAVIDDIKCIHCGVCIGKCAFGAIPEKGEAYCTVYAGGTWGKKQRIGTALSGKFSPSEVGDIVERILLWYKDRGYAGERLGSAIDRVGEKNFEAELFSENLTARRDEILAASVKEKNE
ncbi:MAG: 4Fe-4S binding protein [Clostridia bacterium]|nr:4Fe-4S binding protein [Clostridia bacterium]